MTATTCLAADERPASRTIDLLAAEAASFFMAASVEDDPQRRGRLLFLSDLALDRIRGVAAGGPEAAEMTFGRFRSLDVGLIDRSAKAWEAANRAEAEKMRTAERALAERLIGGAAASVAAGPAIPTFGTPTPAIPSFEPPAARLPSAPSVAPPGSAKVLSRSEIVDRLKSAVVVIFVADRPSSGTGFFISPRHIVTNSHVAAGADRFVVANRTIGVRAAKIVARGETPNGVGIDAAVLETDGWAHDAQLPFAGGVEEGADITIAGFPGQASRGVDRAYDNFFSIVMSSRLPTAEQIPSPKFDFGYVQSLFTDSDSGLLNVQVGLNTVKGNSGSPVVNECGQVVALHYKGVSPAIKVSGQTPYIEGSSFNYSIAGVEVLKFLKAVNAPVRIEAPCKGG